MSAVDYTVRPSLTYQQLLDNDSHDVPEVLRWFSPMPPSEADVPVDRYTSAAFHQVEVDTVWTKVWQMACREEDIPEVGDHITYDIVGRSILVVRSEPDVIKAFHNVCLHRGRRLREKAGRDTELRCAFHGFAWEINGCLKQVPCQWDFPRLQPEEWSLPEVRVGTWGGFVFINMDPNCATLESHLGGLSPHFDRWPLEDRYKEAHVAKVMNCNWKVAQEAFMEAYHVVATHPQLLPSLGDAISQYDVFGNFCRAITPNGVPSPHLTWQPTEQDMFDAMTDRNLDEEPRQLVPPGATARRMAADAARAALRPAIGDRADELCDAELTESIYYTVFPNFHPWGAYNRIVYRFRPYGNDHRRSIMECMFLSPFPGDERPPAAAIHWLTDDEDWTAAPELGMLGRVFNQDVYNLPQVQLGLEAMTKPGVTFADYQETKPRHFHALLDEWTTRTPL
jgi:phenylpropionate dioxygenase-like ring-hydroxylating dioxygenase large terminal subunit